MPRFPFSSYLRRHRRRRRLRGFRIFRDAERSANSIDLFADFPRRSPSPSRSLYLPMATHSTCPLPIRWQLVDTSRFIFRCPRPGLSFLLELLTHEVQTFFLRLVSRVEEVTLRCNDGRCSYANLGSLRWIDSMFSLTQVIHLSCLRRPRAIDPQRASSGLPWRTISSIYRFSIGSLSRDPFCYIYYPLALFILFVLDRMLTSLLPPLSLPPFCRTCPFTVLRFY